MFASVLSLLNLSEDSRTRQVVLAVLHLAAVFGFIRIAMETSPSRTIKLLCSYGGKILPRATDGGLRFIGGHTRVTVDRSICFADLLVKVGALCGSSVTLRCQLPNEDLETLISLTNNEDLTHISKEYDRASSKLPHPLNIRAVLFRPESSKKVSPATSSPLKKLKMTLNIIGNI
ncbi:uncharacterized protein LOC107611558 [Arachis ipaensis]|uniref:uncharacterized protein LOC107611558 n=1 Tax=Arachis ipaensis TaxID=130454 RepID=UPI000A2B4BD1|nr:uncharacterized protein LOC107611558 [Arachis ipaensis]XP_025670569.1 uncharacterized protein LOC112770425 [Arachis hypogaea]